MIQLRHTALIPLLLAGFTLALPAWSQSPDRQEACQKQASEKGLRSGPERMAFMRECVHGIAPAKAATKVEPAKQPMAEPVKPAKPPYAAAGQGADKAPAQPVAKRMKDCKEQAKKKSLHGPARRDFMNTCMQAN